MTNEFIELTTDDDLAPVKALVNLSNVTSIRPFKDSKAILFFNCGDKETQYQIRVKENYETIREYIKNVKV
jgi:hypothetical protein